LEKEIARDGGTLSGTKMGSVRGDGDVYEGVENPNIERGVDIHNLRSQLKSPHFFSMTGIPKFGKNWLDNFIPDEEL